MNKNIFHLYLQSSHKNVFFYTRLKSGWSIKTANLNQWKQPNPLSEEENQVFFSFKKVFRKLYSLLFSFF